MIKVDKYTGYISYRNSGNINNDITDLNNLIGSYITFYVNSCLILKNNTTFIPVTCLFNIDGDKIYNNISNEITNEIVKRIKLIRVNYYSVPSDFYSKYTESIDKLDFSFINDLLNTTVLTDTYGKVCWFNTRNVKLNSLIELKDNFTKYENKGIIAGEKLVSFMYYTHKKTLLFSLVVYKDKIIDFKKDLLVNGVINPKNCEVWINYNILSDSKSVFDKYIVSSFCPYLLLNGFTIKNVNDLNSELFYDYVPRFKTIEELDNLEVNFSKEFLLDYNNYDTTLDNLIDNPNNKSENVEPVNISTSGLDQQTSTIYDASYLTTVNVGITDYNRFEGEAITQNINTSSIITVPDVSVENINNENELIMSFLEEELNS